MSSKVLFSSKDILTVFGLDRRVSNHLNKRWQFLCDKVESERSVPFTDRDAVYYAGLSILRNQILDFMSLMEDFKDVKLISNSKYIDSVHKVNELIQLMERECVYAQI